MLGTWPDGLAALRKNGVRVDGEDRVFEVRATDNPAECKGSRFALVLVKAWQTERAAHQLRSCLPENGIALTLQNGLGNDTVLAGILGLNRVVQGVTTLGATLVEPGLVCLGGEGLVSFESHPHLSQLIKMFRQGGFVVNTIDTLQSLKWGKLVISSAINPLTALLHVNNGELLESSFSRTLMKEIADETALVAKTMSVVLPFPDPARAVEDVANQTAKNQSSMLQDVLRGTPTEIDAINGAIIHLAKQNNLEVPVNRTVWSLVKAIPIRGKIMI